MKKILLSFLTAVNLDCFALPIQLVLPENTTDYANYSLIELISPSFNTPLQNAEQYKSLARIKEIIKSTPSKPSPLVINKVLKTIECSRMMEMDHNVVTIIDYSRPSNEKRLWIYDLDKEKLLFHTYVSHGINSGKLLTEYFSNKYNSKASSLGVFNTEKAYYGRHGPSLRLDGLDRNFNDNAANRAVVMHGGWYVEENFIKRYGRPGRSWGCPAVPDQVVKPIIETIKDKSLFIVYYPNEHWFASSKFLNCTTPRNNIAKIEDLKKPEESRENILFADTNQNNKREESESIVVMDTDNYERTFQVHAPLERMLRRQINNREYIALSDQEFARIANTQLPLSYADPLSNIHFVIPEVKMHRGYYATEMKFVNLGTIKEVKPSNNQFTVELEPSKSITLKTTNHFIRWLGL
ncbi:hypothetical protein Lade_1270 [Legionella adelaidensis]|uniref:Murein L,D-transpeptidase catalytic domain family protein n=1 Tax=Legionella adelaidensis TaxID=45056 RepID=A0A0W0R684_9GAMM|nr:murein L,D-transpeptidase catalytic domain family protein [Legionella adelaidensis]KTC66612.1 hypothetical protein Lade_1270 [Legionella adelaidensis]